MVNGTNSITNLDAFAYTLEGGGKALKEIIPIIQTLLEEGVDELLQQGEMAANTLASAQENGLTLSSGMGGMWIALLVIGVIAAVMILLVLGRAKRKSEASVPENPLFEDQFAVQEDEIEIEIEDVTTGNHLFLDDTDDDNVGADGDDMANQETPTYALSASHEIETNPENLTEAWVEENTVDLEQEEITFEQQEEIILEQQEETILEQEDNLLPKFGPEQNPDHNYDVEDIDDNVFDESENIIRLRDHANTIEQSEDREEEAVEQEEEIISALSNAEEHPPLEEETAPITVEDTLEEASGEVQEIQEENQQARYAAAASTTAQITFSAISHGKDQNMDVVDSTHEQERMTARPYIAPTVLRTDMENMERHQSERIDALSEDLSRQITSLKAEHSNRLDLIINALDRKLENLAEATKHNQEDALQPLVAMAPELTRQVGTLQATLDNQAQRIRAITQIMDDRLGSVSHVYGEVRGIGESIEKLAQKLDGMEQSFVSRAQHDEIADVQLSDVIRSTLSPDAYEFKPLLSNNNRADCLIRLPHPPGAIIVDTKFPLDAFSALPSREEIAKGNPQAKAAEDSFRRSVLRHIIDVAERYIVPGETADSALLFLPTEAIYTTLHARFPDLVRDSFRARVWIVSPSTLMGTLQTLRGVLRDTREQKAAQTAKREAEEVMSEVEALRTQASSLAQNFEATQNELRSLLDATNKVVSRAPATSPQYGHHSEPEREALMSQLYDNKPEWPGKPVDSTTELKPTGLFDDKKSRPDNLR